MKNKNFKPFKEVKEIANNAIPFLSKKLPLAIGIDKEIFKILKSKGLTPKEINYFIDRFFNSAKYVKNCLNTDVRYDLSGNVISEINHSQKMFMRIEANKILVEMEKRGGETLPVYSELKAAVAPYNEIKKEKKKAENKKKKLRQRAKMNAQ